MFLYLSPNLLDTLPFSSHEQFSGEKSCRSPTTNDLRVFRLWHWHMPLEIARLLRMKARNTLRVAVGWQVRAEVAFTPINMATGMLWFLMTHNASHRENAKTYTWLDALAPADRHCIINAMQAQAQKSQTCRQWITPDSRLLNNHAASRCPFSACKSLKSACEADEKNDHK